MKAKFIRLPRKDDKAHGSVANPRKKPVRLDIDEASSMTWMLLVFFCFKCIIEFPFGRLPLSAI